MQQCCMFIAQIQSEPHAELSDAKLASVRGVLVMGPSGGGLANQALQALWPKLTSLEWLHTFAAGQDKLWFPKLVNSSVTVTNGQVSLTTVHTHSLRCHRVVLPVSCT